MKSFQKTVLPLGGGMSVTHEAGPNRWGHLYALVTIDNIMWGGFNKSRYRLAVRTHLCMVDSDCVQVEIIHEGGVFF